MSEQETPKVKMYILSGMVFGLNAEIHHMPYVITADGTIGMVDFVRGKMIEQFPPSQGFTGMM